MNPAPTQQFHTAFPLQHTSLTFIPCSTRGYAVCAQHSAQLPDPPSGAARTLSLSDDHSAVIDIGASFTFFGQTYTSLHVGSNGYLTFGSGDTDYSESLSDHFSQPRISALFDDLNPSVHGAVHYEVLDSSQVENARLVVTWNGVAEHGTSNTNTFQVAMYLATGWIRVSWGDVAVIDTVVGLSAGATPASFQETDFRAAATCGVRYQPHACADSTTFTFTLPREALLSDQQVYGCSDLPRLLAALSTNEWYGLTGLMDMEGPSSHGDIVRCESVEMTSGGIISRELQGAMLAACPRTCGVCVQNNEAATLSASPTIAPTVSPTTETPTTTAPSSAPTGTPTSGSQHVVQCFAASGASLLAEYLTNQYMFSDGTSGTCISDGGHDMYDCGNQINAVSSAGTSSTQLPYRQSTTLGSSGNGDIEYTTYKASGMWLAVFHSASGSLVEYYTSGNNGADGGGLQASGYLGEYEGYHGWYKKVYNARDPSINEIIITTDGTWTQSIGRSTDDGMHRLRSSESEGVSEIFYLMWAGGGGYNYDTSTLTQVMQRFVDSCLARGSPRTDPPPAPAAVQVYMDTSVVDPYEAGNMVHDLAQAGWSANAGNLVTFTGTGVEDWAAALRDSTVIVVPEQEVGSLYDAMSSETRAAVQSFVRRGGHLVIGHAGFAGGSHYGNENEASALPEARPRGAVHMVNSLFGLALVAGGCSSWGTYQQTEHFHHESATWPATVPDLSNTLTVRTSSLPASADALYVDAASGTCTAAYTLPYGRGRVYGVGYDWYGPASTRVEWAALLAAIVSAGTSASGDARPGSGYGVREPHPPADDMAADFYGINLSGGTSSSEDEPNTSGHDELGYAFYGLNDANFLLHTATAPSVLEDDNSTPSPTAPGSPPPAPPAPTLLSLEFHSSSHTMYSAGLASVARAMSGCSWISVDSFGWGLPFVDYSAPGGGDEFTLFYVHSRSLLVPIIHNRDAGYITVGLSPGRWYYGCLTWEAAARTWQVYLDGVRLSSGTTSVGAGLDINAGGCVSLGAEQSSPCGSVGHYLTGRVYETNIWGRVLAAEEMQPSCAPPVGGLLVSWAQLLANSTRHGTVSETGRVPLGGTGCPAAPTAAPSLPVTASPTGAPTTAAPLISPTSSPTVMVPHPGRIPLTMPR
ncbi:hypothetical protein CYMTET_13791 [Cymbomonas tetramitiformis]|uniref:Pentraxin (PTX) domain-containing protein n=1 Tax=Cymbomonas tetramitiformis TaxID=36881 RepID=A0AAE0GHT2_9CHLO|nr:hypothetical protein CYMTET_13791 [Cymbomonas tetramitiformis]